MNPKDELIRRAMLHATASVARPGYAEGGNPADREGGILSGGNSGYSSNVSASSGNLGGNGRESGFAGSGYGGGSGNGFSDRPGGIGNNNGANPSGASQTDRDAIEKEMRNAINTASRMEALQNPIGMSVRLGDMPSASMSQAGVNPSVSRQATNTMNSAANDAAINAISTGSGLNKPPQMISGPMKVASEYGPGTMAGTIGNVWKGMQTYGISDEDTRIARQQALLGQAMDLALQDKTLNYGFAPNVVTRGFNDPTKAQIVTHWTGGTNTTPANLGIGNKGYGYGALIDPTGNVTYTQPFNTQGMLPKTQHVAKMNTNNFGIASVGIKPNENQLASARVIGSNWFSPSPDVISHGYLAGTLGKQRGLTAGELRPPEEGVALANAIRQGILNPNAIASAPVQPQISPNVALPRPRPDNLIAGATDNPYSNLSVNIPPVVQPAAATIARTSPPGVYEAAMMDGIPQAGVLNAQAQAIAAAQKAGIQSYGYNLPGYENQATVTKATTTLNALGQQMQSIQKTLDAYNKLTPEQQKAWRANNPGVIDKLAIDLKTLEKKYQGTYTTSGELPEGYERIGAASYNVPGPGMLGGYSNYAGVSFGIPTGTPTTQTTTSISPIDRAVASGYGPDVGPMLADAAPSFEQYGRGVPIGFSPDQTANGPAFEQNGRGTPVGFSSNQIASGPAFEQYGRGVPVGAMPSQMTAGPGFEQYGRGTIAAPANLMAGPTFEQYGRGIVASPVDVASGPAFEQYGRGTIAAPVQIASGPAFEKYGRGTIAAPVNMAAGPTFEQYGRGTIAAPVDLATGPSFEQYGRGIPPELTQLAQAPTIESVPMPVPRPTTIDPVAQALQVASNANDFRMTGEDRMSPQEVIELLRRRGEGGNRGEGGGDKSGQIGAVSEGEYNLLLSKGYTAKEIANMSRDQIDSLLQPSTVAGVAPPVAAPETAAHGGRIKRKSGGETPKDSYYGPANLPSLPEFKTSQPQTYTMPAASPLVSNFVNSISPQQPSAMSAPAYAYGAAYSAPAQGMPAPINLGGGGQPAINPSVSPPTTQPVTNPVTSPVTTPSTTTPSTGFLNYSDWMSANPGGGFWDYAGYVASSLKNKNAGGAVNSSIENALRIARG